MSVVSGRNVTLVDANAFDLGVSTVSGNLVVTASGAITDSGKIAVAERPRSPPARQRHYARHADGRFHGAVSVVSGRNVTLVDANAFDLGVSTVSGNLVVTASGAITDSGKIAVAGTTTLAATARATTLRSTRRRTISRGRFPSSAAERDPGRSNAFLFGNMTASGSLNVSAGTNLTLPAGIIVSTAAASLNVGTNGAGSVTIIAGRIGTGGGKVQAVGGAGNDSLAVYLSTAQLPRVSSFNGGGGYNALFVEGTSGNDIFYADDATKTITHTTTNLPYNTPDASRPVSDATIQYANLGDLRFDTLDGNDYVTFQNGRTDDHDRPDGRRVGHERIARHRLHRTGRHRGGRFRRGEHLRRCRAQRAGPHSTELPVQNVALLQLFGNDGDDVLVNNVKNYLLPSLLDGGAGNDTIIGGAATNVIFGGLGADHLYGQAGDDYIFTGHYEYEYFKTPFPSPAKPYAVADPGGDDIVDGGIGNNTIVADGGTSYSIYDWLKARIITFSNPASVDPIITTIMGFNFMQPFPANPK